MEPRETEGIKNQPSDIRIYVVESEHVQTHTNHVTKQGFGISTPLDTPIRRRNKSYIWEGKLHPDVYTGKNSEGYISSSNGRENLEELAENFSVNYRAHQNRELQKQGKPSYTLIFEPSEEILIEQKRLRPNATARSLTPEERDQFMQVFRTANETAALQK